MKITLMSLALLVIGCGTDGKNGKDGVPISNPGRATYEEYRKSVYRVVMYCDDKPVLSGSAFKIADTIAATNAHVVNSECIEGLKSFRLEGVMDTLDALENEQILVKSTKIHQYKDLAKLYVNSPLPGKILEIGNSGTPQASDTLLSLSYPLGFNFLITLLGSVVTNYLPYDEFQGYDFMSSHDVDHGSSGSPLIDIKTNKCVGVSSAIFDPLYVSLNYDIAISCSYLNDF